ncbi:iron chelate uptake ABC transporter family permease subunit [Brachybacterium huguangmaarense]|uniref:Iron chelate uptake ABC transporter family permease subunit n=1 Tax=Brachybacterium huguangmaarense TaxID=1652028 RepID=A0ABY6G445_9MICO|nr:iron chelate uptake ABC transporter family permease subunit [Brachybacterium huguangmaarense]UYG17984.1 iron chelate uptake ABC transporter family permease subunit [Brachybacterium huguangmaarense]
MSAPLRASRRPLVTAIVLVVLVAVLALLALGLGDYPLTPRQVIAAIVSDQGFDTRVVTQWRAPRVLAAIVFGAALGTSGALFQTLTRNPLGSPDIIGFSTGAYTGAIITITVLGTGVLSVSAGALIGGLATAFVVYVLAWRGGVQGFRLIVVGIGVTAMLSGLNTFLLLKAQTEVAMAASIWGAGSLGEVGWHEVVSALIPLAVLAAATALLAGPLRQLELGDDTARAHGTAVERTRLGVLVVGVALIALVTAETGPIAFVALAAPQLARRLCHGAGIPIGASALMGALLLLAADQIAQHVIPGAVPVGVITVVIGGVYLIALLIREARRP